MFMRARSEMERVGLEEELQGLDLQGLMIEFMLEFGSLEKKKKSFVCSGIG